MTPRLAALPLGLLLAAGLGAAEPAPVLDGETSRPGLNLFIPGEPVQVRFTVDGLVPTLRDLVLAIRVQDALGREIERTHLQVPVDAPRWTTTIDAPVTGLGYYRVCADLSSGATLPAKGNRSAGFLTYAVVPDPASRRPVPMERAYFGMQGGFNDAAADVVPLLGVRWMMDGTAQWKNREPKIAGEFSARPATAAATDPALAPRRTFGTLLREGVRQGWPVLPLYSNVLNLPAWAKAHRPDARQCALTPAGEAAFRAHCEAAGRANALLRPDLPQRIYEITWEPDIPWGFQGAPADIVRLHALAYEGLHAGDPAAFVIGPCLSTTTPGGLQQLDELLKAGLGAVIDGYSVHPYHPHPSEPTGLVQRVRETRALLRRHTGRDLPLFGTEMGFASWGSPGRELEHARGAIRRDLILLGEGFRANFAFYVHDLGRNTFSHDSGYGYLHNLTGTRFGPTRMSPKPAAAAYAAMTWILEGATTAGAIEWLGDTAWGYAYEHGDDITLALWDWSGRPRPVTIPVGVPEVEVLDWMGNGERRRTADGQLALVLGEEPIYVRGAAAGQWGSRALRPITLADAAPAGFPGGSIALRGTLRPPRPGLPFTGRLVVEPEAGSGLPRREVPVQLAADATAPLAVDLPVPVGIADGAVAVRLGLIDGDGSPAAAAGLRVAIRPPVAVDRVRPVLGADGVRGLAVDLRDASGTGQQGLLTTRLERVPESARETPFTLPPGGTTTLTLADRELAVDPTRLYQAAVGVRLASGFATARTAPVGFLPAVRLERTPVIDGDLGEWAGVPAVALAGAGRVVRTPAEHQGDDDLRADLRIAWDDRALYLAAEVHDDVVCQPWTGGLTWKGDCLQLAVNADQGRVVETSGNGVADEANRARISELAFALTSAGPQVWRHVSTVPGRMPMGAVADLPVAVVPVPGGLRYEIAIPWRQLGLDQAPRAGEPIGLALTVNDADRPDQQDPSALGLFELKRPEGFGLLTLMPGR